MASFYGAAKVKGCHIQTSGYSSAFDEREAFRAFENVFRPVGNEDSEVRAAKRRKLAGDSASSTQFHEAFDDEKSVVLAKVAIDLYPSEQQIPFPQLSDDSRHTIVLSLESFSRVDAQQIALSLFDTISSTSIDFVATAAPDLLDPLSPPLKTAASLATTREGRKRSTKSRIPFCRCVLSAPSDDQKLLRLDVEIRWMLGISAVATVVSRDLQRSHLSILAEYLPDDSVETRSPWALSDFYDAVHVPSAAHPVSARIQDSFLETHLYPFQQRAVDWLLRREGVTFSPSGELVSTDSVSEDMLPISFNRTQDATGKICYVSHLRGMVVSSLDDHWDSSRSLRGGILAEEMGLGKTVELIALMCHHKRKNLQGDVFDPYLGKVVKVSGATLIITPPSILEQWRNEIVVHAPELKVFHYTGLASTSAPADQRAESTVDHLLQFDVVLTTYQVLSKELHYALPPPDRSLRHSKAYERRNSPLVDISWWRVCLDEAQMVESGVSQAAKVARIIPRCNSWAVSGTPLRKDVQDLLGLLIFLRFDPFSGKEIWARLTKSSFRAIFNRIALRHTKDKIRDELHLPPQKRVVITVPFSAIEEQYYADMFRQMCDACFLSPEGEPLRHDRGIDHPETVERMREWLVRLRQTCLNSHVGRRHKKVTGAKNGPLRTVHDVLESMIEQNDTKLKSEAREIVLGQMILGHVQANARDIEKRNERALEYYTKALKNAQSYVEACREELSAEKQRLGTAVPGTALEQEDSDEEDEEQMAKFGRITAIRRSLRSFLELEHACDFFIGTMYYQWKENIELTQPDSDDFHRLDTAETLWYDKAKAIRREILSDVQRRAQRQMRRIERLQSPHTALTIDELPDLGGIESAKILDKMETIRDVINLQNEKLEQWRKKIVDILTTSLLDEDEGKDVTGEEYENSTKVQDQLYVYIMGLRTLIADRNLAVHGINDLLVEHELQEAEKKARSNDEADRGHAPELVLEIFRVRQSLKPKAQDGTLKSVVGAARSLVNSLQWKASSGDQRAAAELGIAEKYFKIAHQAATEQGKLITELEKEQELFRAAMNQRLEFYRQLQHISDTVAPWREAMDERFDVREHERQKRIVESGEKTLAGLKTKQAYLKNLRLENKETDTKQECVICQDEFEIGVLTSCGHKYCKECITQWWHEHRTCPMCKQKLRTQDFRDITFKPDTITVQEESYDSSQTSGSSPASTDMSIYSGIRDSTMKEIKMIDLEGSYGSKVDMIARHLLWIRNNDAGAKTIIFSQFADFLDLLREALRRWKIGAASIRDKDGIHRFKSDRAVECFLLDAKSDSSGLNLVNATYVFLCEPLINPAIELQAIARVHRIGQQRPTTVFMYLVSDSVEESIYDISVSRRLEHMGRKVGSRSGSATPGLQEHTLEAANSLELESAPLKNLLEKKGNGEVVPADDLWRCLFSKARGQKGKEQNVIVEREVERHLRMEAAEQRIAQAAAEAAVR